MSTTQWRHSWQLIQLLYETKNNSEYLSDTYLSEAVGPASLQGKAHNLRESRCTVLYTDKKENKILLIYREIHKEAVAKMTNGLLIYD